VLYDFVEGHVQQDQYRYFHPEGVAVNRNASGFAPYQQIKMQNPYEQKVSIANYGACSGGKKAFYVTHSLKMSLYSTIVVYI
jgi:hypothetical protein